MDHSCADGQKFINQKVLRALPEVLEGQDPMYPLGDIFRFEAAISALHNGASLEQIIQTATVQLTTCIVREILTSANGDKAMVARMLCIDEVMLDSKIFSFDRSLIISFPSTGED